MDKLKKILLRMWKREKEFFFEKGIIEKSYINVGLNT